jgi:hypothetical protein
VEFETKKIMDTLARGVEKCIEVEGNKGIKGYSKCFKMFEYILHYEVSNINKMMKGENSASGLVN